jgi:hypothetical protein
MTNWTFIEMTTDFWEEGGVDISGLSVENISPSCVAIKIQEGESLAGALLGPDQIDALIRALAAARAEISNESPR